jgi:hypothetical protein
MTEKLMRSLGIRMSRRQALRGLITATFGALAAAAVGRIEVFAVTCSGTFCGAGLCRGYVCWGTDTCTCAPDYGVHGSWNCWAWGSHTCCDCIVQCAGYTSYCYCYS